jgi:hypothetical protein
MVEPVEYWGYARRGSRIHLSYEDRGSTYCGTSEIKVRGGEGYPPSVLADAFCHACFMLKLRWLTSHMLGSICKGDPTAMRALEELNREASKNGW